MHCIAQASIIRFASYHRDPRNIALHCWGVPLVLLGLTLLLTDLALLGWALACTTSGLLMQSLGHWYEGRRPTQGLQSWVLAPMFIALQGLHRLGCAQECWAAVERGAGPRRLRDMAQAR